MGIYFNYYKLRIISDVNRIMQVIFVLKAKYMDMLQNSEKNRSYGVKVIFDVFS